MLELFFWGFLLLLQIVFGLLMFYGVFKVMLWSSRTKLSKRTSSSSSGDDINNSNSNHSGHSSHDSCSDSGGDGGGCD
ncbi:hypothetical protein [Psychrobacter sp. SZ93C1]|uniref:hypothetical protein n=1 Tax=Psychrobacter sp. SZ93C1 TaxID=2792058 RepID=UPI0018CD0E15|nr:hypothetical protein [Psychrobacter sp. SZ93C1]MBH0065901.1 hypothetical protein [Psychrobacter sp. SZ93C1]